MFRQCVNERGISNDSRNSDNSVSDGFCWLLHCAGIPRQQEEAIARHFSVRLAVSCLHGQEAFFCVRLPQVEANSTLTNGVANAEKRQEAKI